MATRMSSTARLMQFVHHQNKRPVRPYTYLLFGVRIQVTNKCPSTTRFVQNNSLQFWTAFVQEYFAPGAYMRVTLSGTGPANSEAQGCEARSLGQDFTTALYAIT